MRGRKYKIKRGPLLVVSKTCQLEKAAGNLQGIEISRLYSLNAELLSSGIKPGRLTIWTESSINRLSNEKLFTNNLIKHSKVEPTKSAKPKK
jgi:large subunit ribosomal protein L4e